MARRLSSKRLVIVETWNIRKGKRIQRHLQTFTNGEPMTREEQIQTALDNVRVIYARMGKAHDTNIEYRYYPGNQ